MSYRGRIILAIIGLALLFGVWKVFNTSSLSVQVSGGKDGDRYSYSLVDDSGQTVKYSESDQPTASFRLAKGEYQLLVRRGDYSYYEALKTKSFLGSTAIQAALQPEKSRRFVGNNPLGCITTISNTLVTYDCANQADGLQAHLPADSSKPSLVRPLKQSFNGSFEGFVDTQKGKVALVRNSVLLTEDTSQNYYTLYLLGSGLKVVEAASPAGLNPAKSYHIQQYGRGFVLYSGDLSEVHRYDGWGAKQTKVDMPLTDKKDLPGESLSISGSNITKVYSKAGKKSSQAINWDGNQSQKWDLKGEYHGAMLCGPKLLCGLQSNQSLDVYDVSGKPKGLYSVGGVRSMAKTDKAFLMITDYGVVNFDPQTKKGFLDYSFGGFGFKSLVLTPSGYMVAVDDRRGGAEVLFIEPSTSNKDSIDKKVLSLMSEKAVKSVSAYGAYLYIVSNSGEATYQKSLGGFGYDPTLHNAAVKDIKSAINRLGIEQSAYHITIY